MKEPTAPSVGETKGALRMLKLQFLRLLDI